MVVFRRVSVTGCPGPCWMIVRSCVFRDASGARWGTSWPSTTSLQSVGRNRNSCSRRASACCLFHGIVSVTSVPRWRLLRAVVRPPSGGNVTVVLAVTMVAQSARERISFSPRLNRPRFVGSPRFGVFAMSVQACEISAKPGPSSSTQIRVRPFPIGRIVTSHRVASGASSQEFWISSLTRLQGGRLAFNSRRPSAETENRSSVIVVRGSGWRCGVILRWRAPAGCCRARSSSRAMCPIRRLLPPASCTGAPLPVLSILPLSGLLPLALPALRVLSPARLVRRAMSARRALPLRRLS